MKSRVIAGRLLSVLFPFGPCAICGKNSAGGPAPGICRACWKLRETPKEPACPLCGLPLPPVEGQEAHTCGNCLADPPSYEAHVGAYLYKGPVRRMILLYKDGRRYPLAGLLGTALARVVRRRWPGMTFDAVVYVPSPNRRRMRRGFDPAHLIARETARRLSVPCRKHLRIRKSLAEQKSLSRAARRRNVKGAFKTDDSILKDSRLLLVDDVRTTGATLREAARVLKRAGAEVYAATVAIVVERDLDMVRAAKAPATEGEEDG